MVTEAENFLKAQFPEKDFSIGNDVVYLSHFADTYNELFRNKAFTENEIAYAESFENPILRYASTWAAKEAVYKAVKQQDETTMGFKAVEILRNKPSGEPTVYLHKHPAKFDISLSISHDGDYVWAIAVCKRVC